MMNAMLRGAVLTCWLAATAPALSAQEGRRPSPVPPYGAVDFVPTPEVPIGFRADLNGWYPGAEPPVEWWEGTPARVMMKVARGNRAFDAERDRNAKPEAVWITADAKAKNILWKAPMPGWGDAQPIVVGPRVVALCDPDVVICFDTNTGKVLWQDRLKVMPLPVLGEDRRTLSPPPAPARAEAEQTAWELCRAMYFIRVQGGGGGIGGGTEDWFFEEDRWPRHRPIVEQCLSRVQQWRKLLGGDLPETLPKGMDEAAAALQAVLDARDTDTRQYAWDTFNRKNPYLEAFRRAYRVPTFITWQGHVGGSFSSPVSDGRIVVVCFAYGQVGAYEVATGRRAWAFRDGVIPHVQYMNHGASPWMCGDLVLIRSGDGQAIMGLDKAAGAVRWETQIQMHERGEGANHGNYLTPVLMDVPIEEGGTRKVLVTQEPPVLDPLTGEVLGRLEIVGPKPRSDRGTMVGREGHLFTGWGYDAPSSPTYGFRLAIDGGKLVVGKAPNLEGSQTRGRYGDTPILYRPGAMAGLHDQLYDPDTGIALFEGTKHGGPDGSEGSPVVLCGDLLISRERLNHFNRVREDFKAPGVFWVSDARDPHRPRVLSSRNVLGGDGLPPDVIWDTYMKGLDKRRNLGCYMGIAAWFGCRVGGVVPHGERLFIQSTMAMYCIGPAVKGAPGDDAKVVEAIRGAAAEGELVKHLGIGSAQYRCEAVRRMVALKLRPSAPLIARLKAMVVEDPYEEVRAAAAEVLDAADPQRRPGTALVRENVVTGLGEYRWWLAETHSRLRSATLTVRAMGPAGTDLLAREIAAASEPAALAAWYYLAFQLNCDIPQATDRALKIISEPADSRRAKAMRPLIEQCGWYLGHTAWRDPRVLPALRRGPHFNAPMLEAVCMRSPPADLAAALDDILRRQKIDNHLWPVVTRGFRRLGAEQALPILKKIAADKGELARRIDEIISDITIPDLDPRPEAQAAKE